MIRPRYLRRWVGALLGLAAGAAQAASFTVAVVPQFPAVEIHAAWAPVLQRLQAETGHEFRLVQSPSIPAFEKQFRAGVPDFAFLNPYHAVMARREQGYEPLLRDGARSLTGVLVVRREDPAQRIEDLKGRDVAFPSPNAFGASLYMRALLAERGVDIRPQYVKTHSNAYRHALTGRAAAAGGVAATLAAEDEPVRAGLRVLFETPPTAAHPLVAHPRVPPAVREAVTAAFLRWHERTDTAPLLLPVQLRQPVRADYLRDYAPLERLGLEAFVVDAP